MDNQNNMNLFNNIDQTDFVNNVAFPKQNYNSIIPNFSKQELDAIEIPVQIAKEIKFEKWRQFSLTVLSVTLIVISSLFTAEYYTNFMNMSDDYRPHAAAMIILLVVGFFIFLMVLIDYKHLRLDIKRYKSEVIVGKQTIPYFLTKNYKALIKRNIYINWLSMSIYLFGGIAIGIMYGVNKLLDEGQKINTEIIIMICILSITFVIQFITLVMNKIRKGNMDAHFGYEIVSITEQTPLKKSANKICAIIFFGFLVVILFFVMIPWIVICRKKEKSIIPFI